MRAAALGWYCLPGLVAPPSVYFHRQIALLFSVVIFTINSRLLTLDARPSTSQATSRQP
jgi:hypothetical protein